jgi:ATP phosphoribosyltransferase
MKIKLALPNGSLQKSTFDLFRRAGFDLNANGRNYRPVINDSEIECLLLRPQEIPRYVSEGYFDAGICGRDWIVESRASVCEILNLNYSKQGFGSVRLVLAVANNSDINSARDLEGKRVCTEYVNIARNYFSQLGVEKAKVYFSWGATEAKVPEIADAIVELTETGSSLVANNLRVIDTVLESNTRFVANNDSLQDAWKRAKIDNLTLLLKSAADNCLNPAQEIYKNPVSPLILS